MSPALVLPPAVQRAIASWVDGAYPAETCGLLLGETEGECCRVAEATLARNLERERRRDRFQLNPEDLLSADERARSLGLDVVGVWHSHPDHPAEPSATDLAHAWPGWSYLIVSVVPVGVCDWRSWRLAGEAFVEEVIEP